MVINSSGIMAVCCLIMHRDIISLFGTIMLHCVSSLHHIKKLRYFPQEHLHPGLPPPPVRVEDRVETRRKRSLVTQIKSCASPT